MLLAPRGGAPIITHQSRQFNWIKYDRTHTRPGPTFHRLSGANQAIKMGDFEHINPSILYLPYRQPAGGSSGTELRDRLITLRCADDHMIAIGRVRSAHTPFKPQQNRLGGEWWRKGKTAIFFYSHSQILLWRCAIVVMGAIICDDAAEKKKLSNNQVNRRMTIFYRINPTGAQLAIAFLHFDGGNWLQIFDYIIIIPTAGRPPGPKS